MNRWSIWFALCLAVCGCQSIGGPPAPVSDDCPSPGPCDDPDTESWLPSGPGSAAVATLAEWHPPWPGCSSTLQVMARSRLHSIVFRAVRPDEVPNSPSDPSDWVCAPPDAPLLRAMDRSGQHLAAR